jgi:hypothetical protein
MSNRFEHLYPCLSQWVHQYGSIEIGEDNSNRMLLRVRDASGVRWESARYYAHFDDALSDAESAVARMLRERVDQSFGAAPAA